MEKAETRENGMKTEYG